MEYAYLSAVYNEDMYFFPRKPMRLLKKKKSNWGGGVANQRALQYTI